MEVGSKHSHLVHIKFFNNNRCRGIQESVADVCTSSATFSTSLIVKEFYRSPHSNLKVNSVISHPIIEDFNQNGPTALFARKKDLRFQELRKLPDMVKVLHDNDGSVEVIFNATQEYANFVAD